MSNILLSAISGADGHLGMFLIEKTSGFDAFVKFKNAFVKAFLPISSINASPGSTPMSRNIKTKTLKKYNIYQLYQLPWCVNPLNEARFVVAQELSPDDVGIDFFVFGFFFIIDKVFIEGWSEFSVCTMFLSRKVVCEDDDWYLLICKNI